LYPASISDPTPDYNEYSRAATENNAVIKSS
jgi:hypothetical protein